MIVFIIALAPIAALIIYFYHKDKYEKEPINLLTKAFLAGLIITLTAILIESVINKFINPIKLFPLKIFLKAFLLAGLVEEGCKFYVFRSLIYHSKEFDEPYDGIIYAVMISLGFATVENLAYVIAAYLKSGYVGVLQVGIIRAVFSVPGHACWGVIMGYYFSLAKFTKDKNRERKYIYKGLGLAILAHGLYDFLLFTKTSFGVSYMIITSILLWKFALRKIGIQVEKSPFKK